MPAASAAVKRSYEDPRSSAARKIAPKDFAARTALLTGGLKYEPLKPGKEPILVHDLAAAIRKISASVDQLTRSGINKKGILVLLAHATGLSMRCCETVLNGLADIEKLYCTS